jgi:polynucleotide 5'-hydroxyl-kinase GRC3/NOL9
LNKLKTAVIDADLGQSDVGPPSTIGFNFVAEPVKDLFDIDAQDAVFVGSTSPSGAMHKVIDGLIKQKSKAMEVGVDFLIMNTDGWIEGENAAKYKRILTKTVIPSAVVGIQRTRELVPIFALLNGVYVIFVDAPHLIRPRSREKRKLLRELGYKKYLKTARTRSLSFHWLGVQCSSLGTGVSLNRNRLEILVNLLKVRPLYSEETADLVLVVLNRNKTVPKEHISDAESYFGKRVKVIFDGEEKGLLMGLKDEEDRFLGIGVLYGIDYKRNLLKIYTPVSKKVQKLCFGQIILDKNCREIGLSTIFSNYIQ